MLHISGKIGAGEERKAAATDALRFPKWPRSTGATLGCHGQSSGWRRGRGRGRGGAPARQVSWATMMRKSEEKEDDCAGEEALGGKSAVEGNTPSK